MNASCLCACVCGHWCIIKIVFLYPAWLTDWSACVLIHRLTHTHTRTHTHTHKHTCTHTRTQIHTHTHTHAHSHILTHTHTTLTHHTHCLNAGSVTACTPTHTVPWRVGVTWDIPIPPLCPRGVGGIRILVGHVGWGTMAARLREV